jgi:hypothetical protein
MNMVRKSASSNRAFVVAWLLTLGFALAVALGPSASTEECGSGAACEPSSKGEMRQHREARTREWRGRQPDICTADACEERAPIFCTVGTRLVPRVQQGDLRPPSVREVCPTAPRYRTARG